nr:PEP-CTERM sorting domain-containing protein [uncultured Desulfobacter sp.]
MKKLILTFVVFLTALVFAQTGSTAAIINLEDYAFNINGTVSTKIDPTPANVNLDDFNTATGLGTVSITVTGTGNHYVGGFFDHEMVEDGNTYFNEIGSISGTATDGQTWEIDEPGYGGIIGDIYDNFSASLLDTTNSVPDTVIDDVSMAMAWDFTLDVDDEAVIEFILSETIAADYAGFYLAQTDSDSGDTIYFYSTLDISGGGGGGAVPEPATIILFGVGLIGLARVGRRQN